MIKLTLEYDNKKYSVEIPEPKEEVGELCKKCEIGGTEHPHTPLEVKEGSKDIEPTFTLSVRCEEGVEGCTRLGYHSHTSKNREGKIIWETGKENDWYMRFLHGNNILEVNLESLLSQQEAKIKKKRWILMNGFLPPWNMECLR